MSIRAKTNQLGRNRVYTHHSVQEDLHLMPKAVREKKIQAQEPQRGRKNILGFRTFFTVVSGVSQVLWRKLFGKEGLKTLLTLG